MTVNTGVRSITRLARVIEFHRKQAKLSRVALADIAGVGKTVVYDIENGKKTVQLDTLLKLLGALNISLSLDSPMMDRYKAEEHAES
jgi:transcriptional regulator with XRE-family HTH domain